MDEALRFFRVYEGWIYFFIAVGAFLYIRRLYANWREMRSTIFGLERESAQTRFNQAITILVLLILIGIGEFVIVSYVAPLRPESNPLLTPTIDLVSTATATLPAEAVLLEAEGTMTPEEGPTPTIDARIGVCVTNQLEITSPQPGDQLLGEIEIVGSANVESFGFYKLEVTPQSQATWRTIQAGRSPVANDVLVSSWDTSTLAPGDYLLRLVVTTTSGASLPDCQVSVTILIPQE